MPKRPLGLPSKPLFRLPPIPGDVATFGRGVNVGWVRVPLPIKAPFPTEGALPKDGIDGPDGAEGRDTTGGE